MRKGQILVLIGFRPMKCTFVGNIYHNYPSIKQKLNLILCENLKGNDQRGRMSKDYNHVSYT